MKQFYQNTVVIILEMFFILFWIAILIVKIKKIKHLKEDKQNNIIKITYERYYKILDSVR